MPNLVLTRRVGETIMIGDDVAVKVHRIAGAQVELEIIAPPHVTVHRLEIWHRIRDEGPMRRTRPRDRRPRRITEPAPVPPIKPGRSS